MSSLASRKPAVSNASNFSLRVLLNYRIIQSAYCPFSNTSAIVTMAEPSPFDRAGYIFDQIDLSGAQMVRILYPETARRRLQNFAIALKLGTFGTNPGQCNRYKLYLNMGF